MCSWRRWVEPWYLAYALLGSTVAGVVPILVPLTVSRVQNAGEVGLVMAAVSLGGLTAPVWGTLADRHRVHRSLLAGGLLVTALGLAAFPFTTMPMVWLGLALLASLGAAAMFSLYPVLMEQLYGVSPSLSSIGFGVAAGLALALYSPAGRWSGRYGPARVLWIALGVRLLAFVGLLALGLTHRGDGGRLALLIFLFVVLTWSVLSVSGTALTAELSPANEGQAMGLFNATTAVAGVLGAVLGRWSPDDGGMPQPWGWRCWASPVD